MSRIKIQTKEYRIDEHKDELQSKWKDNRPYVVEYYELYDEEEDEERFLMIWSGNNYELCREPFAIIPILEGHVSDIIEIK